MDLESPMTVWGSAVSLDCPGFTDLKNWDNQKTLFSTRYPWPNTGGRVRDRQQQVLPLGSQGQT